MTSFFVSLISLDLTSLFPVLIFLRIDISKYSIFFCFGLTAISFIILSSSVSALETSSLETVSVISVTFVDILISTFVFGSSYFSISLGDRISFTLILSNPVTVALVTPDSTITSVEIQFLFSSFFNVFVGIIFLLVNSLPFIVTVASK